MTEDTRIAIAIANEHSEKGDWAEVKIPASHAIPTWVHAGVIHSNGDWETHYVSYMIKDGVVVRHVGI